MKWRLIVSTAILLAAALARTQEEPPVDADPPPREDGRPAGRAREVRERFRNAMKERLAELEKTDPEKHAKLMKLHEEDPRRFAMEMRKLMAGQRLHRFGEGNPRQHGPPRFDRRLMDQLQEQDPERWEELQKLRQESPERARQMMREMVGAFRRKHFGRDDQARKLADQYRQTDDEAEQEKLKTQIRNAVETSFDARLKEQEGEIERMMKHLETVRKKLEALREHRDELCDKRVEQLLNPPIPMQPNREGERERRSLRHNRRHFQRTQESPPPSPRH